MRIVDSFAGAGGIRHVDGAAWLPVQWILDAAGVDSVDERKRLLRFGGARFEIDGETILLLPEPALGDWLAELVTKKVISFDWLVTLGFAPDLSGLQPDAKVLSMP